MPHVPRPHLNSKQHKYHYEVEVLAFQPLRTLQTMGSVAVLWTRGSKTAMTSDHTLEGMQQLRFDQQLSLICTLFCDASAGSPFAEKLCTLALIEQRTVGKLSGVRTVGKCKVDISPYASLDGSPTPPKALELQLSKNSQTVGTLQVAISSRCACSRGCKACPPSVQSCPAGTHQRWGAAWA
jgi:hypothetical protein